MTSTHSDALREAGERHNKLKQDMQALRKDFDFYEVTFVQAKPLCKHSGVENLPTGMIFKDGKKVEHSSLRPSEFKGFMSRLAEHAEPEALGATAPDTGLAARLKLENWVAAYNF